MYFTVIVAVFIAFGAGMNGAALYDPDYSAASTLALTILVVALAPGPGMLLALGLRPEEFGDSYLRTRALRRVRIGTILYQVYLLASFALVIYWLDWPRFVDVTLRLHGGVLIDELLRLAPFVAMLVLAWMPLYRIDRVLRRGAWSMREYIEFHLRQYVVFILMPFMVMVTVLDVLALMPFSDALEERGLDWLITLSTMGALFLFAPYVLKYVWRTRRMEDGPLKRRLEELCRRARMGYRDILVWETMGGHIVNACVTGIIAAARFVMVTDALMNVLTQEEIEGVFAHEIGHIKQHHMVYYALFALAFFGVLFFVGSLPFFDTEPDGVLSEVLSVQSLTLVALVVVYWGLLFGFVSRRMELEADLYAVKLSGSTNDFVSALERISFHSGRTRTAGSWRHFSIAKRTSFLRACEEDGKRCERFKAGTWALRCAIAGLAIVSVAAVAYTIFFAEPASAFQ